MTDAHDATRRKLVIAASAAGAGLLLTAGNAGLVLAAQKGHGKGHEKEVGRGRGSDARARRAAPRAPCASQHFERW